MIVDDSITIANAMQRVLEGIGYEVEAVHESATFFDGRVTAFDPVLLIHDAQIREQLQ